LYWKTVSLGRYVDPVDGRTVRDDQGSAGSTATEVLRRDITTGGTHTTLRIIVMWKNIIAGSYISWASILEYWTGRRGRNLH